MRNTKNKNTEEDNKIIESLKYTHNTKELLKYSEYGEHHYFKGYAILKHKFFLIAIDDNILIFDIDSGEQLKRYILLLAVGDNLYKGDTNIIKWNNNDDNQILMKIKGYILLFELTNDIQLKIISQSFSMDITGLKRLSENTNKFYDDGSIEYPYRNRFYNPLNKSKNNKCSVSIY